jgi:hypothetical protein
MMIVCNGGTEQFGTSYSAVILMVEGHREESAEDMHNPVMGCEQGLYLDGVYLVEGATVGVVRGQVKSQDL